MKNEKFNYVILIIEVIAIVYLHAVRNTARENNQIAEKHAISKPGQPANTAPIFTNIQP